MKIRFFAYLREKEYAGLKELEGPAYSDLKELGERLSEKFGDRFRRFYFTPDGEDFGSNAIVFVNGRRAEFLDGIMTKLKEDDVVQIFPVVAGG